MIHSLSTHHNTQEQGDPADAFLQFGALAFVRTVHDRIVSSCEARLAGIDDADASCGMLVYRQQVEDEMTMMKRALLIVKGGTNYSQRVSWSVPHGPAHSLFLLLLLLAYTRALMGNVPLAGLFPVLTKQQMYGADKSVVHISICGGDIVAAVAGGDGLRCYHVAGDTWLALHTTGDAPPSGILGHSVVQWGEALYFFGGCLIDPLRRLSSLYCLELTGTPLAAVRKGVEAARWRQLESAPHHATHHSATVVGDTMFVFGGADCGGASLSKYDFAGGEWSSGDPWTRCPQTVLATDLYDHSAVFIPGDICQLSSDYLLFVGGMRHDFHECNDLLAFRFEDWSWHYIRSRSLTRARLLFNLSSSMRTHRLSVHAYVPKHASCSVT
jgi:hypothetical protein